LQSILDQTLWGVFIVCAKNIHRTSITATVFERKTIAWKEMSLRNSTKSILSNIFSSCDHKKMLLILSCLFLSAPGSKSSIQLSVELSLIFGILTLYCFIVAGIHDDASYFRLKNKYTIDNLETRMKNVMPFVDQIYVIPSNIHDSIQASPSDCGLDIPLFALIADVQ
jgi:hypothetical protein